MENIDRYSPERDFDNEPIMKISFAGHYVKYSDYKKLQEQLKKLYESIHKTFPIEGQSG